VKAHDPEIADRPDAQTIGVTHSPSGGVVGLRDLIAANLDAGMEPISAADAALDEADGEQLREFARNHARWEATRILRLRTVLIERQVRVTTEEIGLAIASELLDHEPMALPDGTIVAFEDMTVAQHEARANWLGDQAGGLLRAAKLHEEIAALLRAEGAVCMKALRRTARKRAREIRAEVAA
jgi:hypothetical protein